MLDLIKEVNYHNNKERAVIKTINSLIWIVTLIIYFAIRFSTYAWHVTWIIFLIAA